MPMPYCRAKFWGCLAVLAWLGGLWGAAGAQEEQQYISLCRELEQAGFQLVSSGTAYGVPFVEIRVPLGYSITKICRSVPRLNADFSRCRDKIAFFNALNYSYVKTRSREPYSLEADTVRIPFDLEQVPQIFPAYDDSLASYEQYLLVDIGKGFLALYARGQLQRVFPISAGQAGTVTPLFDFKVERKEESHWSNIYDAWMPWALLIRPPYFIHGGVLPGRNDSAGCIRLFPRDAEELYNLVEVGTPGRVIETPKLAQIYPAEFCR